MVKVETPALYCKLPLLKWTQIKTPVHILTRQEVLTRHKRVLTRHKRSSHDTRGPHTTQEVLTRHKGSSHDTRGSSHDTRGSSQDIRGSSHDTRGPHTPQGVLTRHKGSSHATRGSSHATRGPHTTQEVLTRHKRSSDNALTVRSEVSMLPTVGADSTMKLRSPVRMVDTDQAGFHVSGWKSLMDRHSLGGGGRTPRRRRG